ncbi:MAG: SDR family NAD(P)-dependent oxidoreductase [Hyphomicrobiaceae bacterium]|nr:SDR family NAD(P)-dependent oxidoreductase [Hyphomicrobiaceae bacterium]
MSDFLERISKLSPKRLALLALELNEKVEASARGGREAIAVVGLGCRLPGAADGPEAFWHLLSEGRDAVGEVPGSRWSIDAYFDADPDAPGTMSVRTGGFLDDVAGFDADYFGISPREALTMDPQQRILLEVTIEALEHAGIAADRLSGSATGVYVGICNSDYFQRVLNRGEAAIDAYLASGSAHSVAAGRLSYCLGLQGPALAIDTACSSSLVALHQACAGLRSGSMDMAIAAGVNVICTPETTIALSKAHMLAPDGRCKTFDAAADGFARAEGCGVLVLKRLADAQAAGDRILAVIRGSASNQDGRSGGLTVPNGPAQEAVIRAALADAGLGPGDIDYVEAHGTGTALGDPIEVRALAGALCADRPAASPLLVGSVKTNLGHLESAAGVAGVIKVILALRHERIPQHLHFRNPSPHIAWSDYRLAVTAQARPWPARPDRLRRAGVSSFGFSGTNAHVVVEEAPPQPPTEPAARRALQCLPLSGRTPAALKALAARYAAGLGQWPEEMGLADIAYTAGAGRSHHAERLAVVAASRGEAAEALAAFAQGTPHAAIAHGTSSPAQVPEVVFMFTGQGAQHPGMARTLYETSPVFRDVIDRCDRALGADQDGRSLKSVLWPSSPADTTIHETVWTQPALFAVEYGLAELWRSCGIRPAAVIGHSVGEYVAACVAGVFGLEDGLRLIAARGRLLQALPRGGEMAAIFACEKDVAAALAAVAGEAAIAAINGPESVVVSGAAGAIDGILRHFEQRGVRGHKLFVSFAAHSPLVTPALEAMRAAAGVPMKPPRIPVAWNVTGGRPLPGDGAPDAGYWCRHLREPVRFADGIAALHRDGFRTFLEVGPHPTLAALARQSLPEDGVRLLHSLRREHADWSQMLGTLAQLYVAGAPVDWRGAAGPYGRLVPELPRYPFERKSYWVSPERAERRPRLPRPSAPLLGTRLDFARPAFETALSTASLAYLAQHRVQGAALVAGPVLMEMAQAAAAAEYGAARRALSGFAIEAPLVLAAEPRAVQVHLDADVAGGIRFSIHSRAAAETQWLRHATGALHAVEAKAAMPDEPLHRLGERLGPAQPPADHYRMLATLGIDLGPAFRSIAAFRRLGREVLARLALPEACAGDAVHCAHPALLDGALQACGLAVAGGSLADDDIYLFVGLERVELHAPLPGVVLCHARLAPEADPRPREWRAEVALMAEDGSLLGRIDGVRLQRASRDALARLAAPARGAAAGDLFYRLDWQEAPIAIPAASSLSPPAAIVEGAARVFDAGAARHGLSVYDELLPALDRLSADLIVAGLTRLGFDWRAGRAFDPGAERLRLGIVDRYDRLFARLLAILAEDGLLSRDGGGLRVARAPSPAADIPARFDSLLARFSGTDAELSILRRCGEALAAVLTGAEDPVQLLFPGGSLAEARKLYVEAPFAKTYNGALAEALRAAAAALPEGRSLRILEIGAGTGGTTAHVLPQLAPAATEYTFTDVSPLFLDGAARAFAQFPFLRFATLDIERDPAPQGFASSSFDVIIASNVLHATADLARTLGHVGALLAPGGLLLLMEGTRPERWVDLTFGLTEGWWRFTDTALRPAYPLVDRRAWSGLLARTGFAEPVILPREPDRARGSAQQSLIMAQKERPRRRFALVGGGRLAIELARRLHDRGDAATCVEPDAVDTAADLEGDIVYLGALPLSSLGPDDAGAAQACAMLSGALPLRLMQRAGPGRLYLVTRGACAAGGAAAAAARWQAPLWGLGRVLALEQPARWGGLVDLPAAGDERALADLLVRTLEATDIEDQTCWRDGRRLVARLVPAEAPPSARAFRLRADATYLVTGGFGGLGLLVGRWLAENGARTIALLGRRPDMSHAGVRAIEAAGARVLPLACDVADEPALRVALDGLSAAAPPLAGIVHAAAHLSSAPLAAMPVDALQAMLRPKVDGTLALERVALRQGADFLVLFSSTTALIGASGLGHYAAANAFLDAVAEDCKGGRTKVVSINWGTWETMRLASSEAQRSYREGGLEPMPAGEALDAMRDLLAAGTPRSVVARIDWAALKELHEARRARPLLSRFPSRAADRARSPEAHAGVASPKLADILADVPETARLERIVEFVAHEVAAVLKRDDPAAIPHDMGLFEMGMDSLMSVELKRCLERGVGRSLPTTLTFNYPSILALAGFLHDQMLPREVVSAPASAVMPAGPQAEAQPPSAALDDLSEDEIEARLLARLERIK